MLTPKEKRRLRQVAHHLAPVIIVAERGISDTLVEETSRALRDHELIKVRVDIADREQRHSVASALAARCGAEIAQSIGKIWVLYLANPEANPKLSNLARAGVKAV